MARINNIDPNLYINGFKGINNLEDDKSVDNNTLKDAINVDITRDGIAQSREGYEMFHECTDGHSLWSDNINMYFVDDENLCKMDKNKVVTTLDAGYKGLKTNYIKQNNSVIASNERFIRRYIKDVAYEIAPKTFENTFTASTFANGGFSKGLYQLAITFVFDNGIEGGTMKSQTIELLEDNLGITMTNFMTNFDPNIKFMRVYVSEINGQTLFKYGDYDVDIGTINLNYTLERGRELSTQFMYPLEPGHLIDFYKGVIYTAKRNIIYCSHPLSYVHDPRYDYIEFESDITLLVATTDGLYVSTEEGVFFLSGNTKEDFNKNLIYNSPAILHMWSKNILTNEIFFFTQAGQIVAKAGGQIENITEKMFMPDKDMTQGASLVKYKNGLRQIINAFKSGEHNKTSVDSWATCETRMPD